MKTTMKLLSLLLCLELVLSPVRGTIFLSSVAHAGCPAGQTFSADVNRCLTSDQVIAVNNAVNSCRSITDEAAKRQCYTDNAKNALDAKNPGTASNTFLNDKGGATGLGIVTSAAAVSVPLFFLIKALHEKQKRGSPCKPASLMLLYAGGASLAVGEIVSFIQHSNKLKELNAAREAWKVKEDSKSADDNKVTATNAQSEAFELLAKNEDSIGQVAKTKMITYGIATGLFAAGAIMGTIEAFQLKLAHTTLASARLVKPTPVLADYNAAQVTISKSQATIKRLTCGKDPNGNPKTTTTTTDAPSTPTQVNTSTKGVNLGNVVNTGASVGKTVMGAVNGGNNNQADQNSGLTPTQQPATPPAACTSFTSETTCDPSRCTWFSGEGGGPGKCGTKTTSIEIQDLLNQGIKTKAAKNLQHARSYAEMMELLAEINSLQFENYSRDVYNSDSPLIDSFQNIGFSKIVAKIVSESLVNSAQAQTPIKLNGNGSPYNWTSSNLGTEGSPKNPNAIKTYEMDPNQMQNQPITTPQDIPAKNNPEAVSKVKDIMNKAVYTPTGRLITNGLLGVWMGIMTAHMHKVVEVTQKRADLLRKMKGEFDTGGGIGSCTSADRDDPGKPACYCFTSEDKLNPARSKSKICSNKLATLNLGSDTPSLAPKVCVDETSGVDPSCSCRNKRGPDGKNTCAKVGGNFNMMGLNAGTFKMISASAAPANDLFNGNASTGNFNPGTIGSNAARIKKVADDAIRKDKLAKKMMKDLENSLVASTAGISATGPGFSQGSNLTGMTPQQAAAALEKELKKNEDLSVTGPEAVSAGQAPSEEQPEFGMTEEQLAAQETEVAEVMNQELDMGNNDINNSSNTNLFDVLSNRYQRSGMRRLFDEEGKTKAEKPAESDIAP